MSSKVPKINKILQYEMKFLVPNYSCLQNPWPRGYSPQIPVISVLCPQLNLLNTPEKNSWVRHWHRLPCVRFVLFCRVRTGKWPRRGLKSIGDDYLTRSLRLIVRYSMQRNQEFPIASLSNPYVSVSQTFFKWGPLSLVRMFYGPPYSWDYQTY